MTKAKRNGLHRCYELALLLTLGSALTGCSMHGLMSDANNKDTIVKKKCVDLDSSGSELYLRNSCNEVREIKIKWHFSNSNETKLVSYRVGTFPNKGQRAIQHIGTVGQIVSDGLPPILGELDAINDIAFESTRDDPEPGQFVLWIRNKGDRYIYIGVQLQDPDEDRRPIEKEAVTPMVIPPLTVLNKAIPILQTSYAPAKYRLAIAEYEPK